jgi:hypothetical protein
MLSEEQARGQAGPDPLLNGGPESPWGEQENMIRDSRRKWLRDFLDTLSAAIPEGWLAAALDYLAREVGATIEDAVESIMDLDQAAVKPEDGAYH